MTPRESLELHVPEPDPPRRSGCLSVLPWLALVVLLLAADGSCTLHIGPSARQTAPEAAPARLAVSGGVTASPAPSYAPAASGGVSFLVTAMATWCAPTPKQCQSWGGNAKLAAVNSFRDGDEPYLVRVKHGSRVVTVLVVSYCACLGTEHAIDLSPAAFKVLAPLSRGRIDVVLEWPVPELPRTDTDLRMQAEVRGDGLYR